MTNAGLILEARVCTLMDHPCALCSRPGERNLGMTETYLQSTGGWVCYDCALGLDRELALFAYAPEQLPQPNTRRFSYDPSDLSDQFGVCPECGGAGGLLNIGKSDWCLCYRHGLRWWVGANFLFSSDQSEEEWSANYEVLVRCREVEPFYRAPRLREEIVSALKQWSRNLVKPSRADEEVPF